MAVTTPSISFPPMDIRFWLGGTTRCTVARWNSDVEHEPWSKLYLVESGAARYAIARPDEPPRWCQLRPGHIHLIPGGRRHINACASEFILHWCHFTVQDEDVAQRIAAMDEIVSIPMTEARSPADVISSAASGITGRLQASALVLRMLALLPDPVPDSHAAERRRLAPAVGALEYRFDHTLSVPQLAAMAGMKPSRFHQLFRLVHGTSVHAYQLELRCAEAQRLLRTSTLSIQEIAQRCGYPSPFSFTRMFTDRCRVSPSAYRASTMPQ